MTSKLLLSVVLFSFLSIFAKAQDNYHFEVKMKGLAQDEYIILANYFGDNQYVKDTAYYVKGSKDIWLFEGEGTIKNGIYLLVLPNTTYMELVIGEKEDQTKYFLSADTNLDVTTMQTKGMEENALFMEFNAFTRKLSERAQELTDLMEGETDEKKKASYQTEMDGMTSLVDSRRKAIVENHPEKFIGKLFKTLLPVDVPEFPKKEDGSEDAEAKFKYSRDHYWDHYDMTEEGYIRTPIYHNKLKSYITQYFMQQPDSIIAAADELIARYEAAGNNELFKYAVWWITKHYEDSKIICMDKVLWHMATKYYCGGKAFWADSATIEKFCDHAKKIGPTLCQKVAPDMSMPDTTGRIIHRLSNIDSEITVVVFWDPKCGHCKKEIPLLQKMYDTLQHQGVSIYAVYTQGDWEGWKKYIRDNKITFLNVGNGFNTDNFRENYNIISTPQIYVLDDKKVIRFKKIGAESLPGIIKYMKEQKLRNKG